MLGRLGRHDQRVTFCEEVVRRFGRAEDAVVRCSVADVLNCKGGSLEELGRSAEAIAAYDEVEQRFGGDTNADVRRAWQKRGPASASWCTRAMAAHLRVSHGPLWYCGTSRR